MSLASSRASRRPLARVCSLALTVAMFATFVGAPLPAVAAPGTPTYETEPNDAPAQANVLAVDGTIMNGSYATAADDDWYAVALLAGHTYSFQMGPNTDQPDYMSDVWLELWDPSVTTQIAANDDWNGLFSYIEYTPDSDATYFLKTCYLGHSNSGPYGIRAYETGTLNTGDATISGTVTDMNDDPVAGVNVVDYGIDPWYAAWPELSSEIGNATTADDGTYTISAGIGNNTVGFFADGYYDVYYNQQSSYDSADQIAVVADDAITGIDAQLEELPPLESFITDTSRASVDADGMEGVDEEESYRGSRSAAISADGNFVALYSGNSFVAEDDNGYRDWYLKNMSTGEMQLVSVSSDGTLSDADYSEGDGRASVSGDGRYVAFDSPASNLVDGDTNGEWDVFVRDMVEGTTVRVSVGYDEGSQEGNDQSCNPSISDDGRYVAFDSWASNLVEGDTNGVRDVFVYDMETGETIRASVDSEGVEGDRGSKNPDISPDGTAVAFLTGAAFVEDDTNGTGEGEGVDVYVKWLEDGSITRGSVSSDGTEGDGNSYDYPSLSSDGRYVAFASEATNLVEDDANDTQDIFVHDFDAETTVLASVNDDGEQGWGYCEGPSINADGTIVAFEDEGGEMEPTSVGAAVTDRPLAGGDVNNADDIVIRDMVGGTTSIVSASSERTPADDGSEGAAISGDGMTIAYDSYATNLVEDDMNETRDVFVGTVSFEHDEVPLAGPDRYETAIAVSQDSFPEGADSVVIATGENWPDALGGSALAGMLNGPVLLARKAYLPLSVADEIERLGASEAYVLGDFRALSNGVYDTLVDMLGAENVHRIGGTDRYGTANLVAAEVVAMHDGDYDGTAFVATGLNFADALAASPIAAANGWPVYLSGMPTISDETIVAMQNAGVTDTILLGGEAAMPEGTSIVILGAGFTAVRIDGADRYETAAKVAEYGVTECGLAWNDVALATGEKFPDALSGGVAQGLSGSVLLLTRTNSLSPSTQAALEDNVGSIGTVRFFGGLPAISQTVRDAVAAIFVP